MITPLDSKPRVRDPCWKVETDGTVRPTEEHTLYSTADRDTRLATCRAEGCGTSRLLFRKGTPSCGHRLSPAVAVSCAFMVATRMRSHANSDRRVPTPFTPEPGSTQHRPRQRAAEMHLSMHLPLERARTAESHTPLLPFILKTDCI